MDTRCDVVVIGGGFYGLYLAEFLAARVDKVVLCERAPELMRRASYGNQARVHNGYHYPRSVLTAVRSRINFPRFVEEFRPAIDETFEKVYAVSRRFSKVSASQFSESMRRIGAPLRPAPKSIGSLFDAAYIEAAFLGDEYAFNAIALRDIMSQRVRSAGVEIRLETVVQSVQPAAGDAVCVDVEHQGRPETLTADNVFCCGYAELNAPGAKSNLPQLPLKHELAELALVEPPDRLRGLGITVMDGPFFSLMPFPALGLHTLSHVRYTPHAHWYDGDGKYRSAYEILASAEKRSAYPHMVRDAARYLPALADCTYRDSLWEVKTVLPRSEFDDSRPILFRPNFGLRGYHLIMGGKIDNVYDIADALLQTFGWSK